MNEVGSAEYTEISVRFSGGDGELAWQQAQLFRTDNDAEKYNMTVTINFA